MTSRLIIATALLLAAAAGAAPGTLQIDVSDVSGTPLASQVDLFDNAGKRQPIPVPTGQLKLSVPEGAYTAHIYVYDGYVPLLVGVKEVRVVAGDVAFLLFNLYESTGGQLRLRDFDSDGDLVIDGAELDAGTNPGDSCDYPGGERLVWPVQKLGDGARWYRGELHAHSRHGEGKESVSRLITRAEKAGLDFLAIADRNTLAACEDKGWKSDKLVLIPAMEWGNEERGVALIYVPGTVPPPPGTFSEAQALCLRTQAQGGLFAVAHPCRRDLHWGWGISYVNAVQVWYQGWRIPPPLPLTSLDEDIKVRDPDDKRLVYSIAAAAAAADAAPDSVFGIDLPDLGVSANRQNLLFYEFEQARGLIAGLIAGSGSREKDMPLAEPVTYIHAEEYSLPALMEGLRLGRTYLSSGLDGPQLLFVADVLKDQKVDVTIGGIVPIDTDVLFTVGVKGGLGKKVRLFRDGHPIATRDIDADPYMHSFEEHPMSNSSYRMAVVSMPVELTDPEAAGKKRKSEGPGYGAQEFHAISGTIYSRDITRELLERMPGIDPRNVFIRIDQDTAASKVAPPAALMLSDEW